MRHRIRSRTSSPAARDRILSAAHDLFYRRGVRSTGIDLIIRRARVTKVTFYRHFRSKNRLVRAFLDHRHELWMAWFHDALLRHGRRHRGAAVLKPALREWFRTPRYRGCAFLNAVSELSPSMRGIAPLVRRHKSAMIGVIAGQLRGNPLTRRRRATDIALLVDGAIIQSQFRTDTASLLRGFDQLVRRAARK